MAKYHVDTHKCTLMGTMLGGNEIWTTSFWMGEEGFGATIPTQAAVDAIAVLWQAFFTHGDSKINSSFKTTGVKLALIDDEGESDPDNTKYKYYATPISGTSTDSGIMPPQVSLCATLTSAKVRGWGSKGRMYLPGVNAPLLSDGHINSTTVLGIVGKLKTFLDGVNASVDVTLPVALNAAATFSGTAIHGNGIFPVTGVKIGNVYDTQRRRRNQLVESYQAVALA